jgi:FkbM family methyltransferase
MDSALHSTGLPPAGTRHHAVFEAFERTLPLDDATHHVNFMGARIAHEFERDLIAHNPRFDPKLAAGLKASGRSARYDRDPTYPLPNSEDYFEWIDLLTAIDRARSQFTMIEIGAGYGRWIGNAAAALNRRKSKEPLSKKLIALEANKERFEMMERNCADNNIAKNEVDLHRAACTTDGKPVFMIVNNNYGEGVWSDPRIEAEFAARGVDALPFTNDNGQKFVIERMPGVKLDSLLTGPVDFIDMDIQGAEMRVVPAAIDALDRFVKLIHIGTHSAQIDETLGNLFRAHGWRPRHLFACAAENATPYGTFAFIDGIQSWENPRFD